MDRSSGTVADSGRRRTHPVSRGAGEDFSSDASLAVREAILADESEVLRIGLRRILEQRAGFRIAAESGDGNETLRLVLQLRPKLLILDPQLPGFSGSELVERLSADPEAPARVIAFTNRSDRFSIIRILKVGARGYLLKTASTSDLLHAIEVVLRGQTYLSPSIAGIVSGLATRDDRGGDLRRPEDLLSSRETEVLQAIALGKQNKEIADELNVAVRTIESHRAQLMRKLDLRSVAALTKYAIREGLASIDH